VIGNPPYRQLQKLRGELSKKYRDNGYDTFTKTGDIYQLFCEKGYKLLNPNPQHGLLSFITSNSWLRAEYGKSLREYFEPHNIQLIELGKDTFKNAIVDASILILNKGNNLKCHAVDMDYIDNKDFPPAKKHWKQLHRQGKGPWLILSREEKNILNKIEKVGTPLKEWHDISIYYGIKTGCDNAFVIDNQTKEALVARDGKSAEIIKPVLRGRDIKRYRVDWQSTWVIDTHQRVR